MRLPIAFVLSGLVATALAASADDFDTLRLRWKTMLTGGPNLDLAHPDIATALSGISSTAESWWATLNKASNRTALWSDAASMGNNSAHITITYQRLRTMALGYATRGTTVEGNAALRADLISALDWMNANRYNKSKSVYDNWWDWQIGSPLALNDLTVLLYDDLSATQIANYMSAVDKFTPEPDRTAANRVWLSSVVVVRGVIVKNSSKITSGRNGFTQVFSDVTSGDGFYADGSFVQHETLAYTGGYGASLLMNLVPVMDLLNGSTWQVTDAKRTNVFRWIHKSYQPFIYNGAMMDMVRGREISREAQWLADNVGSQVIASILRCAQFAPPADAAAFKSMAKYWIQADPSRAFVRNAPVSAVTLALEVLNDPYIPSRGELIGNFQFPRGDRVVHSRPGFGFGLSMSSSRIANFECLNNENMRGWFTGEGMTYLYNGDTAQFGDNFWPTVNSYRLPGTTVEVRTRANGSGEEYRGAHTWVGGASLGAYGVAGMQLDAWSSTLTAKKSWFMFDDEIVALGAGITSSDKRTIETVVENRKLTDTGDNAFLVNDQAKPATLPWSETMTGVSWAHLAGNVPGADIGYYFPQPATLKGQREARTHSWFEINAKRGSTSRHTRNYLSFWFDHGSNPANATYSYVLLPNKTAYEVGIYASAPDIVILENTARAQAVRENNLNITAVNFWNDGTATVGGITVDKKAAVMTRATDTELEVAVADPTQKNSGTIKVEIAMAAAATLSVDPGVTVTALSPKVKLTVNVKSAGGRTFHARFQLPPAPVDVAIPLVTIAAADSSTAEAGADPGRFTLTRSVPTNLPLQVFYGVGGTASNGVDYTMLSGSATIPAGFFTADVMVTPVNDAIFEDDETVIATLLPNATYAVGAANSATVAIHDDEPVLTVTATNPNAAEQGTVPGRFVIVRSGSTAAPLTVQFTVGGTASSPSDYASLGTAVTLAAGASSINLDVLPVNDGVSEGTETVILALTPNPAFQIAGTGSATVTIADADASLVPIVTIVAADSSAAEAGADSGRFTLTRSVPTNLPLQVFYGVGGTASNDVDYTMLSGSATIPAGFFTADVMVTPVNDAIFEGDETVIATLLPNATYAVGASNSATVAIHDDEPVLTVTATNPNAAEQGTVPGRFVIVRSGSTAAPLTVPFTVGGTASSPSDYASLGTAVTLAAGASSTNLDVLPVNDGVSEGTETVILALTPNPAFQIAGTGSATVTIADADASLVPTPLVELNLNEGSGTTTVNAGALGGNFTLTAPRPAWTANVPPGVGGTGAIDYGTTIGNFGVDSPDAMPGLRNLSRFTITGWINNRSTTQGSGGNRVLRNFVSGGHGIDLVYRSDGSLDLGVNAFPSSVARSSAGRITTSSTADTANWRFFAVTYDSSLGANHVQFFFGDAVNDAALDVIRTYARGPIGSNIGVLTVGHVNPQARSGSTDRMFRGLIDNVCLFDAALTQSELVAVQRGVKPPLVVAASILAKDIPTEQSREPNSKAILGDTTSSPELSIGPGLVWRRTDSETLVFSWPAACAGCRLQSRTNTADVGLDAGWMDVPGGSISPVTVPILKTSPGAFFRLKSP